MCANSKKTKKHNKTLAQLIADKSGGSVSYVGKIIRGESKPKRGEVGLKISEILEKVTDFIKNLD